MAITQLLTEPELTTEQAQLRSAFLEETGYGPSDLLSANYDTQTFLTMNGGKYRIVGSSIKHLAGPPPLVEDRDQWEL